MFKNFLMQKMLKSQLKGMPEVEQEKLIALVSKNPEFFQKLALEIQEKNERGKRSNERLARGSTCA